MLIEKIIFWTLYVYISMALFFGTWNRENPLIGIITFLVGLIVWYFILKGIFWVIRRLLRPIFIRILKAIARIPKVLWQFTLNRVREFGKALRDED